MVPFHKAITQHQIDATEGSLEVDHDLEVEEAKQGENARDLVQQQSSSPAAAAAEGIKGPVAPMGVPIKTTLEIQEFDYQMLEREVLNHMRRNSKNQDVDTE